MTEEQGYQIIALLEKILNKLPDTAYDLGDIYSEISSVKDAVDSVTTAIEKLDLS